MRRHDGSLFAVAIRVLALVVVSIDCASHAAAAGTLEAVREHGELACGVVEDATGYSTRDSRGEWSGLGVDLCRAVALAALGKKEAVRFHALGAGDRFQALRAGRIDLLVSDAGLTSSSDGAHGVRFTEAFMFDGQGFLVRRAQGVTSALELSGTRVCVMAGTGDEQGVMDYFAGLKIPIEIVKIEHWADAVSAYDQKSCHVLSASISRLAAARAKHAQPQEQIILPELAQRHAIGAFVRQGDEAWFSIIRWTTYALFSAEDLGVTSSNVEQMKSSSSPEVRRFLAGGSDLCKHLGLMADWTQGIIRQLGNYGELYERHFGAKAFRMERGLNNLAGKGGLHFAPSFR